MLKDKEVRKIAQNIELIAFDVDGVLTDGNITYTDDGNELKSFSVQDGLGLVMLLKAGIHVAVISSRTSHIVSTRMADLGVKHIYQGAGDKKQALEDLMGKLGIESESTAFVGDDLIDLPAMSIAGLSIAVANAVSEVKSRADWITETGGGKGGVREICDLVLEATGRQRQLLKHYTGTSGKD